MRKRVKYFLLVILSLVFAVCSCVAVAGCSKKNNDEYESEETIAPDENDGLEKVERYITVLLPDGSPIGKVEVRLNVEGEDEPYCGAKTGSDGVAKLRVGKGLDYVIYVIDPPEGYEYSQNESLGASEESKTIYLSIAGAVESYSVTVKSEGGLLMEKIGVTLRDGETVIARGETNADGVTSLRVPMKKEYAISLDGIPDGYSVVSELKTSAESAVSIVLKSEVISSAIPANKLYAMGDIMYDFEVLTSDSSVFKLSEVLKNKRMVLLNFWATWCGPCLGEFDDMERVYQEFKDDVAIISLSTSDSFNAVKKFKDEEYSFKEDEKNPDSPVHRLTFDMAPDSLGLYDRFSRYSGGGIPVNVIIDRYGRICDYGVGGLSESVFRAEFQKYTADDYVQSKYKKESDRPSVEPDKPDVEMPASEKIAAAVNNANFSSVYKAPSDPAVWPWVIGDDEGSIVPANLGHHYTTATIRTTFNIKTGNFLTFDYKLNTEDIDGADYLYVYIGEGDGTKGETLLTSFNRYTKNKDWETCYVYTPLKEGEYTLRFSYVKDHSDSNLVGREVVAIRDIRIVTEDELKDRNVSVNILRDASTDFEAPENQDGKTSNWKNHVQVVLGDDGLYHVGTKDGPYLLANLLDGTHYTNASITALISAGYFARAGLTEEVDYFVGGFNAKDSYIERNKSYAWFADVSAVYGYTVVDETLKGLLDDIAYKFSTAPAFSGEGKLSAYYTKDTWLEFCSYYDHYGVGEAMENPLIGLSNRMAIEAKLDDGHKSSPNHVVIDKSLVPRGKVYEYKCVKDGAYRVYSAISSTLLSQTGGYAYVEGNSRRSNREEDAVGNYNIYVTFEAGKTYYISTAFGLPQDFGEFDFYIEYVGESYEHLVPATDGTYTYDTVTGADGKVTVVTDVTRTYGIHAQLGEDDYYHQILWDGSLDSGDTSYMWVDMLSSTYLFGDFSLQEMAQGHVNGDEENKIYADASTKRKFFDLTLAGDKDYSSEVLEYVEKAEKSGELQGKVKADEKLVEILKKALTAIGHNETDAWFGLSYFYDHVGVYPANKA